MKDRKHERLVLAKIGGSIGNCSMRCDLPITT